MIISKEEKKRQSNGFSRNLKAENALVGFVILIIIGLYGYSFITGNHSFEFSHTLKVVGLITMAGIASFWIWLGKDMGERINRAIIPVGVFLAALIKYFTK